MSKRMSVPINYVFVAADLAGGVVECARKMHVSRQVVSKWIKAETMRSVAFQYVQQLSEVSGIPIEKLAASPPANKR